MNRLPVRKVQPKGRDLFQLRLAGWKGELTTVTRILGDGAVTAEERSKIEKIVDDSCFGARTVQCVHRVRRLRIGVVEPRSEHSQTSQIAPLLMWDQVVRVVAPDAFIQVRPHQFAVDA